MAKEVKVYVLDSPDGVPVAGAEVEIVNPAGTNITGGTTNPVTTGSDGSAVWSKMLSPGPIVATADVPGSDTLQTFGSSLFQIGTMFASDIPRVMRALNNGYIAGVGNELAPTMGIGERSITIGTGHALNLGYLFEIDVATKLMIAANASLAQRIDAVVFREHLAGSATPGKQEVMLVLGTVTGVKPTIKDDTEARDWAVFYTSTANGASVSTLFEDNRTQAGSPPVNVARGALGAVSYLDMVTTEPVLSGFTPPLTYISGDFFNIVPATWAGGERFDIFAVGIIKNVFSNSANRKALHYKLKLRKFEGGVLQPAVDGVPGWRYIPGGDTSSDQAVDLIAVGLWKDIPVWEGTPNIAFSLEWAAGVTGTAQAYAPAFLVVMGKRVA